MVHEIAADLAGAIGHPVRQGFAARVQQQPRGLDRVRRMHEDFGATPSLPSQRLKRKAVTRPSVPTSTFMAVVYG